MRSEVQGEDTSRAGSALGLGIQALGMMMVVVDLIGPFIYDVTLTIVAHNSADQAIVDHLAISLFFNQLQSGASD